MTFWSQDYHMTGSFASKVKLLAKSDLFMVGDNKYYFFARYMDVIKCGAIVGLINYNDPEKYAEGMNKLKLEEQMDDSADIPVKTILLEQKTLKLLFRIVILNEQVRGLSLEDKVNHAFRNEAVKTIQDENEEFFNNIVALGVDYLYNIIKDARDAEACLDIMEELLDGNWEHDCEITIH